MGHVLDLKFQSACIVTSTNPTWGSIMVLVIKKSKGMSKEHFVTITSTEITRLAKIFFLTIFIIQWPMTVCKINKYPVFMKIYKK